MIELRLLAEQPKEIFETKFRDEDELECHIQGVTAAQAAQNSAKQVEHSYAVYADGELIAFAGYKVAGLCGPCDFWLLTTPAVERHKLSFVRFLRQAKGNLYRLHQLRTPCIHVEHKKAIRLASRFGFIFGWPRDGFVIGVTD